MTSVHHRKPRKQERWYVKKGYLHFDLPLSLEKARELVTCPETVAKHQFLPFLSYEKTVRRYRGKDKRASKSRPIKYASHRDGYIYAYYSMLLSDRYEQQLRTDNLTECVIAYRPGMGSNITFSRLAFDEIERRGNCVAIALDISGFFDNIDHANLKKEWARLLGTEKLPDDHYAVFNSLTRWSEVNRDQCYERMNVTDKTVTRRICKDHKEYRERIKGRGSSMPSLVHSNKRDDGTWKDYGIPQGSPASALLSNIYMQPFDKAMMEVSAQTGGYYRRYCDDILWICDAQHVDDVLSAVDAALKERGSKLERKEDKTERSIFSVKANGLLRADTPFQYLGFEFDGRKRLIRSQTLARYWRRVVYAVRATKRDARKAVKYKFEPKSFRKKLNHQLTHLGKGNFVTSYAYRAQKEMGGGSAIKQQLSGHYERIGEELDKPLKTRKKKHKK